jgi:hypothetical protein
MGTHAGHVQLASQPPDISLHTRLGDLGRIFDLPTVLLHRLLFAQRIFDVRFALPREVGNAIPSNSHLFG